MPAKAFTCLVSIDCFPKKHACMCVSVCVYVCMHVCVYMRVWVCMTRFGKMDTPS